MPSDREAVKKSRATAEWGAAIESIGPYLIARMDECFDNIPTCREKISKKPSEYLSKIYVDTVVFFNIVCGSDYPHTIGDIPGTMRRVNALPPVARARIRGGNTMRIFGFRTKLMFVRESSG
jgi:hypothetical protein